MLYASETLFLVIKLAGAAYLLWIAYQLWGSESSPVTEIGRNKSLLTMAREEFALAAGNPKAILIFTAFLPQFVDVSTNVNTQFLALGTTFLLLELVAIALYALFGLYLRHWFSKPKMAKRFNRACAAFLAISGVNLLVSRQ